MNREGSWTEVDQGVKLCILHSCRSAEFERQVARELRLEYEGAVYHVLSRGNYRADVFGRDSVDWKLHPGNCRRHEDDDHGAKPVAGKPAQYGQSIPIVPSREHRSRYARRVSTTRQKNSKLQSLTTLIVPR